jgi:hypothetical protein
LNRSIGTQPAARQPRPPAARVEPWLEPRAGRSKGCSRRSFRSRCVVPGRVRASTS